MKGGQKQTSFFQLRLVLYVAITLLNFSEEGKAGVVLASLDCRPIREAFVSATPKKRSHQVQTCAVQKLGSPFVIVKYAALTSCRHHKSAQTVVSTPNYEKHYLHQPQRSSAALSLSKSQDHEEAPPVGPTFTAEEDEYFEEDDELSEEIFERLEDGQPPFGQVFSQLLGINIFTYILAGAIAIMLTANAILGPGWLGQVLGLPGTGTFTDVSKTLPSEIDLSKPEYLL